ncbi:MAG: V-type ATP synthase subunit E family protein [Candidatus Thalassarchaeum sp.]|jgi:V/A-type H+-transporting ATPase subunit E|nr:V-type ATP synthase subunit E family protein [Candidatus Thalassarchaeum sp.]HJM23658.1 V-type ATP synthase subunit E family protein [Candidatus Thalassarchaeum sp.]
MSLDKLASEIESMAKAEAKVVLKEAKAEAKRIGDEAKDSVAEYRDAAINQAEKMSDRIAVESIAAARQRNQKRLLVVRRTELDATWSEVMSQVGKADLKGRVDILESLIEMATAESGDDMILRPVAVDREILTDFSETFGEYHDFQIGGDIDGLGGFVLESPDGSVLMDYRFEGRLRDAWEASLGEINNKLFGE